MIFLSREPSRIEKSRHFVYVRALITRKILRSKDAQCNTRESPKRGSIKGILTVFPQQFSTLDYTRL